MYQISNQDRQEIIEYLSVFARMAYHRELIENNLRLQNQGRRASILVSKLMRKKQSGKEGSER